MDMRILSVNVGRPEIIVGHKAPTGIVKRPVEGPVTVGAYGLAGDAIMDTKNHGGLDQAVYLYGEPDYAHFARQLGRPLEPGLFGENLTVSGLESQTINIGDRLTIGDVVLEVTSPRNPCATFAARMGDPHWVRYFLTAGRLGIYGRVLETGSVAAGMPVTLTRFPGTPIPVNELSYDYKHPSPERMRYLLEAPLHRELRAQYEAALAQPDLFA
jgi:MOSC domain-containing protein YiiM